MAVLLYCCLPFHINKREPCLKHKAYSDSKLLNGWTLFVLSKADGRQLKADGPKIP